jgi:flavodoxin I
MKAWVIYDSVFGNTEQVARAIGDALGSQHDVEVRPASDVAPEQLAGVQLLVAGAPTQKFRPTPAMTSFLKRIPADGLKGVRVAAFDTRISVPDVKSAVLSFFVKLFGPGAYAAKHIADRLVKRGGNLIVPPEGFIVEGTEGPLREGELERAASWAEQIMAKP